MTTTDTQRRAVRFAGLTVVALALATLALGGTAVAQDDTNATNATIETNVSVQDAGDVVVDGTINGTADNATVTAAVVDGPSADAYENETVEDVGPDGEWNVTLNATGSPEAGTYELRASANATNVTTQFQVTEDSETATETETESPTGNETETAAMNETATETTTAETETDETTGDNETGETDGEDGPGFGVAVALVALLAVALLAVRR